MRWHWTELPSLLLHLPASLHHLETHEDKQLVEAGLKDLHPRAPGTAVKHGLILPQSEDEEDSGRPSEISMGKNPGADAQQNLHLLAHDYLQSLPEYEAHSAHAEKLLEHWHELLMKHPHHGAEEAHHHAREFWAERTKHHGPAHPIAAAMQECRQGEHIPHPHMLGGQQAKQWCDLVIRQRIEQHMQQGTPASPARGRELEPGKKS